jgi:hypothetical protein
MAGLRGSAEGAYRTGIFLGVNQKVWLIAYCLAPGLWLTVCVVCRSGAALKCRRPGF